MRRFPDICMILMQPIEWRLWLAQAARPLARRALAGEWKSALRQLQDESRAIIGQRLWPIETRVLGEQLPIAVSRRKELFFQADLVRALRPYNAAMAASWLSSKARFAQFCQLSGLPHPPTVTVSAALRDCGLLEPLGQACFVKPDHGSSGAGVAVLRRNRDSLDWTLADRGGLQVLSLEDALQALASGPARLIQPLLGSAALLATPAGYPPVTLRIVTGWLGDEPQALAGLAQFARDATVPLSLRWLDLPIDPVTAICAEPEAAALAKGAGVFDFVAQAIGGSELPRTREALGIAKKAHACLVQESAMPLPPMIGWDLALTDAGPILLEGNWNWGVAPHYSNAAGFNLALSPLFAEIAASSIAKRSA